MHILGFGFRVTGKSIDGEQTYYTVVPARDAWNGIRRNRNHAAKQAEMIASHKIADKYHLADTSATRINIISAWAQTIGE